MWIKGGYRDALHFHPGHPVEFDTEAFIASRPPTMRPFLLTLLHLQAFEQFIHDRLDMLNSGRGFKGAFELEANNYVDKMDTQRRYTEWIKVVCRSFKYTVLTFDLTKFLKCFLSVLRAAVVFF